MDTGLWAPDTLPLQTRSGSCTLAPAGLCRECDSTRVPAEIRPDPLHTSRTRAGLPHAPIHISGFLEGKGGSATRLLEPSRTPATGSSSPPRLRPPTGTEKGENEGCGWKGFGGQGTPKP